MFAPEHIEHPFSQKGRWKVIFYNSHYDMWKGKEEIQGRYTLSLLKEFSLSFHDFVMDISAFEEFLSQL